MPETLKTLTQSMGLLCHQFDMGIEGELGHVVGVAANVDEKDESIYTNSEDAKYFVDPTGVDCLAIAVGTAHGEYPEGLIPHINFQRIREVKDITNGMPIALHGGSGSGDENILKAVEAGINKVNMVTDVFVTAREYTKKALKDNPGIGYINLMMGVEEEVKTFVEHWIDLTGSEGKAKLFTPVDRKGLMTPKCVVGVSE